MPSRTLEGRTLVDDEGYEGEGDFALYLYFDAGSKKENYERVIRSHSKEELETKGRRHLEGGRYKAANIYKWDYQKDDDAILIECL